MKREKFIKKRRWLISIILTLFLAMVLAMEQAEIVFAKEGKNVTQNWAAAAVFYDTQADETETFHMTEEEFLACKTDLEARLVYAYSACLNSLPDAERRALEDAQKAWLDCYYSYISALEQKWLGPVKIFFGVTGKERRTNVYREIVLLMLTNRITDLEEWNAGEFVRMEDDFILTKESELTKGKEELQVDMGLCLYVIQEDTMICRIRKIVRVQIT